MSKLFWMTWREFVSYFFRPAGWLVLAAFLFLTGWFFSDRLEVAATTELMRPVLTFMEHLLIFLNPLIAMRTIAGEREQGTLETLMTAPVRTEQVIISRYIGASFFLLVLILPTLYYAVILNHFAGGAVDFGPVLLGYGGTILCASFFLAAGVFLSSISPNQFMAAVFTFFLIFLLRAIPELIIALEEGWVREFLTHLNYRTYLNDFRRGIFDTRGLLYFVSGIGLFLAGADISIRMRRYL